MHTKARIAARLGLTVTIGLACGAPALAQALDCGPGKFLPGEVDLNVARIDPGAAGSQAVLQIRFLGAAANVLQEQLLTLLPGQSRALPLPLLAPTLVRVEIVPMSGPDDLQVRATLQGFGNGPDGLTYGPIVRCANSGDTIDRPTGG